MSLIAQPIDPIPEQTATVAHRAFPQGRMLRNISPAVSTLGGTRFPSPPAPLLTSV